MSQTVDFLMDLRNFVLPLAESVHQLRQNVDRDSEDTCGLKDFVVGAFQFVYCLYMTNMDHLF